MVGSLAERLRAHEQQKARLAGQEAKLETAERKACTRQPIGAGGPVDQACLLDLEANALYGALLPLRHSASTKSSSANGRRAALGRSPAKRASATKARTPSTASMPSARPPNDWWHFAPLDRHRVGGNCWMQALAVRDNTSGERCARGTLGATIARATDPIAARRHSVDPGLMQVNGAKLPAVDLSIADAFGACQSMRAGSEILFQAYHQVLRAALSTCNTGNPIRGIANGYVAGPEAAAATAVPSIVAFAPTGTARASPTHDASASAGMWNFFAGGSVIPGAVRWRAESPE